MLPAMAADVLIEGEAFQFKGRWVVERSSECLGSAMLRVYQDKEAAEGEDAFTVFTVPQAGNYSVWVRSRDYAGSARPRSFTLSIDGTAMAEAGLHGLDAFYWEKVGNIDLAAKQCLLRLTDTGCYYGRCDAILLTTDATLDPNTRTNTELARFRRNPVTMKYDSESTPGLSASLNIESGYTTLATVSNDQIRLSFVRLAGSGVIVAKTDYYHDGRWRRFGGTAEDNRIAVIASDKTPAIDYNNFYPSWEQSGARHTLSFEGVNYAVMADGDRGNPFYTGEIIEPQAIYVSKSDASTIKVSYTCGAAGTMTGYWTVPENGTHIGVRLQFTPAKEGNYSLAMHGIKGVAPSSVKATLMPPMFTGSTLPASPVMMCASMMTQCMAAVETNGGITSFISADLDDFPKDWGSMDYSPVGFTLVDSRGEAQPVAFAPVPGMADSRVKAKHILERSFVIGINAGTWGNTLEYVSDNVFGVEDYRKSGANSLSKTIENIIRLAADDEYSGWNPQLKGFWDIETNGATDPTVVQSAPLALLGASALCDDETLYMTRALPGIEFVLSRSGYRFRSAAPTALDPYSSQFATTMYEGINALTGGLNPWLAEVALPDGEVRCKNGYFSTLQEYRQELSAYRLTGDKSRLDKAIALADAYAPAVAAAPASGNFYNSQMIQDWTPLLDMYRETGDEKYLAKAEQGAAYTIAGVKTWPRVAQGMQTVHPGDTYDGVTSIWWKGAEQFRLGFPRQAGDAPEHSVEAWKVSSVGLGIEQPATYFLRTSGRTVRPVYMTNWAARLAELGALSGRSVYDTYSRNAVIGRADNYPGYYATGYTDIVCPADFPYIGPDVSSIYYHHIPAHLAMLQDFLISRFVALSKGEIDFEPARQEGFVWFANNIFGARKGTVGGAPARLWLPLDEVSTDNADVSVILAKDEGVIYVLLLNDGDGVADVNVSFGSEVAGLTSTQSLRRNIAARSTEIVTLPAADVHLADIQPLESGMKTIDTGTDAGKIYLFRIRSPFGWDTLYGYAGCSDVKGLTIEVESRGNVSTANTWPYEWSFARYDTDEQADVNIRILKDGVEIWKGSATFSPVTSTVENVSVEASADSRSGIYTIEGRKIDKINAPGVYICNGRKIFRQ